MIASDVVGVVLVAGKSERMEGGRLKQLLPFGDTTMAGLAVANAEASQLDRVVVVTGRDAGAVAAALGGGRSVVVRNSRYESGNVTSLLLGVEAAGEYGAVLLLLGDMPGVTPDIIDRFVGVWREERPWAALAAYEDGVPNHPFLLSAAAVAAMPETSGSKVLWRHLVEAPPGPVATLSFSRAAPIDVDTQSDYEAALAQLGLAGLAE